MTKLIFSVGIPGAGKSTILKDLAENNGYVYISPDDIRKGLSGDAKDQSRNDEVWQTADARTVEAIENGKTVVFDATMAKPDFRIRLAQLAREAGAQKVQAVYVDVDLETAKERNIQRDRHVPEYVIERMHHTIKAQPPSLDDGIDSVFTFDEFKKITEAEIQAEEGSLHREFKR